MKNTLYMMQGEQSIHSHRVTGLKILKIFMKEDVFMTTFENDNLIMPMSDDGGGSTSKNLILNQIGQRSFPEDNPDTSGNNSFCQATCYLAVPKLNIKMSDLQKKPNPIVGSNGYMYWSNSNNRYFTDGQQVSYNEDTDKSKVITAISNGYPVILKGKNYGFDHWVVVYGYAGNDLKIMDPWEGKKYVLGRNKFTDPNAI